MSCLDNIGVSSPQCNDLPEQHKRIIIIGDIGADALALARAIIAKYNFSPNVIILTAEDAMKMLPVEKARAKAHMKMVDSAIEIAKKMVADIHHQEEVKREKIHIQNSGRDQYKYRIRFHNK